MQLSKWEVWPWNWRRVRKAQISRQDRDLFERYGEAVIGSVLTGSATPTARELQEILPHYEADKGPVKDKFVEARDWLTECRDTQERREQRLETIEIGVVALITLELVLSLGFGGFGLWEGAKQGQALDRQVIALGHMDTSTATTSESLQKLLAAQDASLKILEREQAERGRKPKLALYVGDTPIDRAIIRAQATGPNSVQDSAALYVLLRNEGEAPVSTFRVHALVPKGVIVEPDRLFLVPEFDWQAGSTLRLTMQFPPLPAGETQRIHLQVHIPKGRSCKIPFTADAVELQSVASLGSLTVLPPKP